MKNCARNFASENWFTSNSRSASRFWTRIICCFFLLLIPMATFSADGLSLSGTVSDPSGGRVAAATVTLYDSAGRSKQLLTDAEGRFAFEQEAPGSYVVECSKTGFQKLSRRINMADSGNVELQLELAGLDQHVIVIASELPELWEEISKSVSMISQETLINSDALTLNESLRQIPSLQVQQQGGPGALSAYRMRGMRPEDAAVLLDGFRVLDPTDTKTSARPFLSFLTATDVDRIEVLRGAGSTLYGTNAMGGAINMISQEPRKPLGGAISLQGGSLGLLRGGGEIGGFTKGRRVAYSLRADHINYTRGQDGNDPYRVSSGSAYASIAPSSESRLVARFQITDAFLLLNESPTPVPGLMPLAAGSRLRNATPYPGPGATFIPQLDDPDFREEVRYARATVRWDHSPYRNWNYSVGFQNFHPRRLDEDGPAMSPLAKELGAQDANPPDQQRFRGEVNEFFWRNNFFANAKSSLHFALGYDHSRLDQTVFGLRTEAAQGSLSLQLQNQTRLLDHRLHIHLAYRAQRYDLDQPRFNNDPANPFAIVSDLNVPATHSGDAAVAYYFPRTGTKVRVHAGNGYRSPSLFERFGAGEFGGFRSYFGDPRLRAEKAVFADGGIDQSLFREKLQMSATYFYTYLNTIIDFGPPENDPFDRFFGYVNLQGGHARGVEISAESRPAAFLQWHASYTLTKSIQPSATSAGTTRVLGLSDHQFSYGVNVSPSRRVNLNLQGYSVSDYDYPAFGIVFTIPSETYRFAGYTLLDVTGSLVLRESDESRLRYVLKVENLLDRQYYQGGFLAPGATVRTGVHWEF
ncbi:MAG: hypothetical protein A3F68_04760 [Acidobacteria bacterium RIFCSPLOWO2_12_FULL_54_10]|nr:MAG: hypothetical protein A3F68_04760 [Acidobacteria bacterium RIFCSPLOWO2_12_FULL_54_10]